jgi:uncharacterized tellurite resistance protein B-like protein
VWMTDIGSISRSTAKLTSSCQLSLTQNNRSRLIKLMWALAFP